MRSLPDVALSPCPPEVARFAVQGWDSVQEAIRDVPTPAFCDLLKATQEAARDAQDDLEGVVSFELMGYRFNAHATGARGGFKWRISNDDVMVMIGSREREWTITVRYLSAGLWEHGLEALRARTLDTLAPYVTRQTDDRIRVTRADWCFDFYAPAVLNSFTPDLVRGMVCHSSTKAQAAGSTFAAVANDKYAAWSRGPKVETLTIGSKSALQVQLYDKSLEIDEASGKTWLYEVWERALGDAPWRNARPSGICRLECRFAGEFLKMRNVRRPDELVAALPALIAEALFTRRLTIPQGIKHRERWPLHPIWSEAYRQTGAPAMLPIGYKVTGRRDELRKRALKQLAGSLRSLGVLDKGGYNSEQVLKLAHEAFDLIERDPEHTRKVYAAIDRYRDVDEAR